MSMLSVDAKDRPDVAHVTAVANKMRRETMSAAAAARADAKRQAEEAKYGNYREESKEATLADGWPGQAERPRSGEAERPSTRGGRSRPDRPASGDGRRRSARHERRPDAARPPSAGARPRRDDGWADERPGTSSRAAADEPARRATTVVRWESTARGDGPGDARLCGGGAPPDVGRPAAPVCRPSARFGHRRRRRRRQGRVGR